MIVSIDTNSGFCFGVTRAIKTAESELQNGSLCCLGDIVHNGQEVARLEVLGLATIDYDDLRTMPAHSRVLLRAHGEPPSTYWIAKQRGIEIIDATCPVVKKLQDRIRLQGQTNNTAVVIESIDQLDRLDFTRSIYLFSQTTKSVEGFNALVEAVKSRYNEISKSRDIEIPFEYHDTICRNVANRVEQLQSFARANDIVLFVGGTKSSNARVLYNKCLEANPHTLFVSSPDEVEDKLKSSNLQISNSADLTIGICGATSTPLWLMEQVRDKLSLIPSLS